MKGARAQVELGKMSEEQNKSGAERPAPVPKLNGGGGRARDEYEVHPAADFQGCPRLCLNLVAPCGSWTLWLTVPSVATHAEIKA
jgi:hypothetical protein